MKRKFTALMLVGLFIPALLICQDIDQRPENIQESNEVQENQSSTGDSVLNLQKKTINGFKILGSFSFGSGGEKFILGETTEGDDVYMRSAGGFGFLFTLGYNFFSKADLELAAGYQLNSIKPDCDNLDGYFSRVPLLITAKVWIPTKDNAYIKLGGGGGYYTSVQWEMDGSESFGLHEIVNYDNAASFHFVGEYEIFSPVKPISFLMGLKYYHVNFNASSFIHNGTDRPLSDLSEEYKTLKGSGVEIYFGFGWYF